MHAGTGSVNHHSISLLLLRSSSLHEIAHAQRRSLAAHVGEDAVESSERKYTLLFILLFILSIVL